MVTIAHLVEKEISKKPYLQEALARDLINYGSLADNILPKIQKEFHKPVKHSAVMMALRRLSDKLEKKAPKSFKFASEITITLKSGLFNISYKKSQSIPKVLQKIYETVDYSAGDMLAINLGNNEVTIVSNNKHHKEIKELMKKETVIQETKKVAAVSLSLSINLMDTPGFFYLVTKTLTWEDVNVLEVVSTPTELTIIVDEKDVTRAYEALNEVFG